MKLKITFLALLSFLFLSENLHSQGMAPSTGYADNIVLPTSFSRTMIVKQKLPPKGDRKGSPLLFSDKQFGTIYTSKFGILNGIGFNYDVEKKLFELHLDDKIKLLPEIEVDSFEVNNLENNTVKYVKLLPLAKSLDPTEWKGFGKVITEKKHVYVVDKYYLHVKESNYNLVTNTGNKYETIAVQDKVFVINDENAYKMPLSKKEAKAIFGHQFTRIEKEVKSKNLKITKKDGFIVGLEFL